MDVFIVAIRSLHISSALVFTFKKYIPYTETHTHTHQHTYTHNMYIFRVPEHFEC